jgi:chromosome segregation ATPase
MSDESIDAVIQKFIAADEALRALQTRETELTAAAQSFQVADSKIQSATASAAEALSSARESFQETAATAKAIGEGAASVLESLGAEIDLLTQLLAQVSQLEPERLAGDLSEIRRDLSDQGAELRELRRLENDTRMTADRARRSLEEMQTSQDQLQAKFDADLQGVTASQADLAQSVNALGHVLWMVLAVAVVGAVLAGLGVI